MPVAVVTGAGRGIGRATALLLAERGFAVGLVARGAGELEKLAAEVRGRGATALVLPGDVADEAAVEASIARVLAELGRIDVLVNNAGFGKRATVGEITLADWQRQLAVNATGTFLWSRAVLPAMRAQGGGTIVNVGSGAATRGYVALAAYCAAKHAIVGFSKALQLEVLKDGIAVSCVSPGPTDTRMGSAGDSTYDAAAMLRPDQVAEAIVFVATRPPNVILPTLDVRPRAYL